MTALLTFSYMGNPQQIKIPDRGSDLCSVFLVGLPKAGSTLLNRIMQPLCERAGLSRFSLHNEMRRLGVPLSAIPEVVAEVYQPQGYAYTGFRGLQKDRDRLPTFASGRTVYLIRDPRDMVVSKYFSEAFSHNPPGSVGNDSMARAFEQRRQAVRATGIDNYAINEAQITGAAFVRTEAALAAIEHRVWRYEDIIFDKLTWVQEMLDYLGLDAPNAVVERVVERHDVRPETEQVEVHVRRVTPGDHRNKLDATTINRLNNTFAPILKRYGYA